LAQTHAFPLREPKKGAVRPVDAMDAELCLQGEKSFSEKVLHRLPYGDVFGVVSVE
jgi:hypothetical protein